MGWSRMSESVVESKTIRFYLPKNAASTPDVNDSTVADVIKSRSAREYGGYTVFEASGGWLNNGGRTVKESVKVIEVRAAVTADIEPMTFAKVNARYIYRATDESMVMATVDNKTIRID